MNELNDYISQLREDFMKGTLSEKDVNALPYITFEKWMKDAIEAKVLESQACHLTTVNKQHKPSGRIVYLREFGNNSFYFYTNYNSRKGIEISENNQVSLTFFWPELERQIRIEGTIEIADKEKSDLYFINRPTESKIGAWSSPQSQVIDSRQDLEKMVMSNTEKFTTGTQQQIPRPDFWGGYKITANYYEFWQGRKSRLHDRICYIHKNDGWEIERLAP